MPTIPSLRTTFRLVSCLLVITLLLGPLATPVSALTWTNRTTTSGLVTNWVYGTFVSGATLYAATIGALAISTDGGISFTIKTTANGLGNNKTYDVFVSGATVYVATQEGLSISTDGGNTFINKTTAVGLGSSIVLGVFASGATVYAATAGGLSISTDGGASFINKTTADGLGHNFVYSLFVSGGTIYVATFRGLSISTDGGNTFTNKTMADGLGSDFVWNTFVSGATVYAATITGLSISTDGGASFINKTTADGLGSDNVYGVFVNGAAVYAATAGGLSISTNGGASFTNDTTANGLGNNSVRGVFASGGMVYAATEGGLSMAAAPTVTTTTLACAPNPSAAGQTVTCTATITESDSATPGGTLAFKEGASTITGCANLAVTGNIVQCVTTALGLGVHSLTAVYSGDPNFVTSTSSAFTQTVAVLGIAATSLQSSYPGTGPSSFTISFSQDVNNPAGDTDPDDVTNPANFMLLEKGANKSLDTVSCLGGVQADDTQVTRHSVTYSNLTATVTLSAPLQDGNYQLFICATTSIVDLFGNPINGGVDVTYQFTVGTREPKKLPNTGFAPDRMTSLPAQPASVAYTKMSGLWLEIPSQKIQANIFGVPEVNSNWDVSWLGNDAGWLNGTAFPTWKGNSVLTAHVTDANGLPGPFANLKNLAYGNKIVVHLYGEKYTYEVRQSRTVFPGATLYAFEHLQDHAYLTLITCQGYNFLTDSYMFRRVVRAVLVSVTAE